VEVTWIVALCGAAGQRGDHWAHGAPLHGWAPTAIASSPTLASTRPWP